MGKLFAQAAKEARTLTLAMGASPDTFNAGSIPWTGDLYSPGCRRFTQGTWGKTGHSHKKGKSPARILNKLSGKWRQAGNNIQLICDLESALACGEQREVDLALLRETFELIKPAQS